MGRKLIPSNRVCYSCGSDKTYIPKTGHPHWYKHDGNLYCQKCNNNLFVNPKWRSINDPIWNKYRNPRRIKFRGRRISLTIIPRTGQCSYCKKRVGDEFIDQYGKTRIIKHTQMHHIQYHPEDPLKDTVELCPQCHVKESWKLGSFKNKLNKVGCH